MHLHFLVWLQRAFYLAELGSCLLFDLQYAADIVKFIDNIIYYLITDISMTKKISQEALLASLDETDKEFALKLYTNSNAVASNT